MPPRNSNPKKRNSPKAEPIHDIRGQLKRIEPYVLKGERLHAVFDCKDPFTGFVGFTDKRLIFFDEAVVLKHKNMMSIPFKHIVGVAASDDGVVFRTSEITIISAAGRFSFEFRGADKARWAYEFIMRNILR